MAKYEYRTWSEDRDDYSDWYPLKSKASLVDLERDGFEIRLKPKPVPKPEPFVPAVFEVEYRDPAVASPTTDGWIRFASPVRHGSLESAEQALAVRRSAAADARIEWRIVSPAADGSRTVVLDPAPVWGVGRYRYHTASATDPTTGLSVLYNVVSVDRQGDALAWWLRTRADGTTAIGSGRITADNRKFYVKDGA